MKGKAFPFKRFIVYPLIIGYIATFVFQLWNGLIDQEYTSEELQFMLGDSYEFVMFANNEYILKYAAYSIGFAYGTLSLLFPVRRIAGIGILGFILFYIKLIVSMFLIPVAMIVAPIELITRITFFIRKRSTKIRATKNLKTFTKHKEPVLKVAEEPNSYKVD